MGVPINRCLEHEIFFPRVCTLSYLENHHSSKQCLAFKLFNFGVFFLTQLLICICLHKVIMTVKWTECLGTKQKKKKIINYNNI